MTDQSQPQCPRRFVLQAAGVGAAALGLAACSGGGAATSATTPAAGGTGSAGSAAATTVKVSEVPVGGGVILKDAQVIVTQPAAGEFKAYTSVCPHMGSLINSVHDGLMECPLHHSEFSITDGSVVQGPATTPLPTKTATVSGDTVTIT